MVPYCCDVSSKRATINRGVFLVLMAVLIYATVTYLQAHQTLHFLYNSAIVGGLLSGSLHALTGSDHLAALLPLIFGKRWVTGGFYGLIWGLGHGFTSSAIGFASYSMKSFLLQNMHLFDMYGFVVDGIVGLTLMIIGICGYYESLAEASEHESNKEKDDTISPTCSARTSSTVLSSYTSSDESIPNDSLSTIEGGFSNLNEVTTVFLKEPPNAIQSSYYRSIATAATVFVNGSVMGLSWDGLPSLAPAVVLESWPLMWFLLFYALGTAGTMCFAAGLVGETTCWISRVAQVNVTERLASLSSLCAIIIGSFWTISGIVKCAHNYYHVEEGEESSLFSNFLAKDIHDATVVANDQVELINSNDNFHEHSYTSQMEVLLSCGSVLAVVGVIIYATQYDLGALPRYMSVGSKPTVYKV